MLKNSQEMGTVLVLQLFSEKAQLDCREFNEMIAQQEFCIKKEL